MLPDVVITGLFSLLGAIIGAGTSIFILSRTMKKNLQHEIRKIELQTKAELSVRLLDKEDAYIAELLVVISTVRNVCIDVLEFGYTDETCRNLNQSYDIVSLYLNAYEKRNILYVPKIVRHEAAQVLHAWKSFCNYEQRKRNHSNNKLEDEFRHQIKHMEKLVELIKREIGRD